MELRTIVALVRHTRALPALALAAAIASCGGSTSNESNGTAAVTQPATRTRTPAPKPTVDRAADRRVARRSALRLDDLPPGWTKADDETSPTRSDCGRVEAVKARTTARTTSPRFNHGAAAQVSNSIYVFGDAATAEEAFSELTTRAARRCYSRAVTDALRAEPGVDVGRAESARVSLNPLGDQRRGSRVTVPVSARGINVDVVIDLVFVRADRGLSLCLFIGVVSPFDDDVRDHLTADTVRRLSNRLADS
jgi:hypothetical protein